MMIEQLLDGLNERQQLAVTSTEGYIRVIAGAGSGKTKTLANRYAYLVDGAGISPDNILSVTFTNKAAEEMRNRIKNTLQDGVDGPYITTYHGFCVKVLREESHHIYFPKNFTILDQEDQHYLLQETYEELGVKLNEVNFNTIFQQINLLKQTTQYVTPFTAPGEAQQIVETNDLVGTIVQRYLEKQRKYFAFDFNDLMSCTLYIFENYPDVLQKWQDRLYYIQVDEFQDSSAQQIELVTLLSKQHGNLFVVGDPDQAIYTWRGAKPEYLVDFDKKFPQVTTILLEENYRSTPEILQLGNELIQKNSVRVEKKLFTQKKNGLKVTHVHAKNEIEEMKQITEKIQALVQSGQAQYNDFAILYRAHYLSNYIEQGLMRANIPYSIYGGFKFYERQEIKMAICYLRMMGGNDDYAFLRTVNAPSREIGKSRIQFLKEEAKQADLSLYETLKLHANDEQFQNTNARDYIELIDTYRAKYKELTNSTLLRELLEKSGYDAYLRQSGDQDRVDNISELLATLVTLEKEQGEKFELDTYLQSVALMTDKEKDKQAAVKLMTIHTSKGLEFPYVFIASFSDGVLPNSRSVDSLEGLEEERRLAYVAITRAMKELYITESETAGNTQQTKLPSRFMFEVSETLFTRLKDLPKQVIEQMRSILLRQPQRPQENSRFAVGTTVKHPIFGTGTIQEEKGLVYLVQFTTGVKPIQKSFAGLIRQS